MNNLPILISCSLAVGACGFVLAAVSLMAQRKQRKRGRREMEALRGAVERQQMACLEMFSDVNRSLAALEEGLRGLREAPKSGGLNRSARAQAIQMLRAGHSAEDTASGLGIGRREMRLLESVSRTLCEN